MSFLPRRFLRPLLAASLAATSLAAAPKPQARQDALDRPRRIIFNNDGNDPVTQIRRPSVEDMLAARTTPIADSQVDAIFYCTFSAGFGNFTHFSKVGQVHTATEDIFLHNQMPAFVARGIDPLVEMIKFAHGHRKELFWSMRMNDTHDGGLTGQGPVLFAHNRLKQDHPEYLFGRRGEKLKAGSWSGVDYGHPEIRELAFRYVEEVCRNYDVDGIELDFFRHPVFFRATTRGERCSTEDLAAMTALLRRIRTVAEARGTERGRPILIAVRAPDSIEYCQAIGLDLERWLREDLADVLIPAGYFQLNDWDSSVALGHRYGLKVYPSLDESRLKDTRAAEVRMTDLAYRGRAAVAWAAGADGVYIFNQFDPRRALWRELGDPVGLRSMDKDYFASIRGDAVSAGGNFPTKDFLHVETLSPGSPRMLGPGAPARATLQVAEAAEARSEQILRLRFSRAVDARDFELKCNGRVVALRRSSEPSDEIAADIPPGTITPGANVIDITTSWAERLQWTDLRLSVRHPPSVRPGGD